MHLLIKIVNNKPFFGSIFLIERAHVNVSSSLLLWIKFNSGFYGYGIRGVIQNTKYRIQKPQITRATCTPKFH